MEPINRAFKRKTIEKIIRNKMNHWISTLKKHNDPIVINSLTKKPELTELQKKVKENYIVTGGAIASMLLGELPNDFDVYFANSGVAKEVAQFYMDKELAGKEAAFVKSIRINASPDRVSIMIQSAGIYEEGIDLNEYQYFESYSSVGDYFDKANDNKNNKKHPYSVLAITSNAITLSDDIQLIFRFVGAPYEIHKNYDFVHTTNYFTEEGGLVLDQEAIEATMTKELKYIGSLYPICSVFRLRKFIKRGWTITAGEILKICFDISKLDLNDRNILREQLVGVDQAYFNEVIAILNKNIDKPLDRTYLFDVINRVFDDFDEE